MELNSNSIEEKHNANWYRRHLKSSYDYDFETKI